MYTQGYLEVYENEDGEICIVSKPNLRCDSAEEISINKSDIDNLIKALNAMKSKIKIIEG